MKNLIYYLPIFILISTGCGTSGFYEYSQYEDLDHAYRVLKGQEKRKLSGSSISNRNPGVDQLMKEHIATSSLRPLSTPVLETQKDSLFENWGIYEKNADNSEDTLFYVHLVPKISRIGEEGDEIWVIESVLCNWWQSWRIRGFDLRPFVDLSYMNANFEPGFEDERINSDFILKILIDQSTLVQSKQSYIYGRGVMDSRRRLWVLGFSDGLLASLDAKSTALPQLIDEDWEIRSRGNVFQGLNR
ncbi:MAG: hypothetical protein AAGD28_29495 [Bacteroidota bacterium]